MKAKRFKPGSPAEERAEGPKVERAEEKAYQASLKKRARTKKK